MARLGAIGFNLALRPTPHFALSAHRFLKVGLFQSERLTGASYTAPPHQGRAPDTGPRIRFCVVWDGPAIG